MFIDPFSQDEDEELNVRQQEAVDRTEITGPTWGQGPITPDEELDYAWDRLLTPDMTYDEFLTTVPAYARARLYDAIATNLVLQPSKVDDELIEIFGEAHYRDPWVFIDAGMVFDDEGNIYKGETTTVEIRSLPKSPFESQEGYEARVARQQAENPSFESRVRNYMSTWGYRYVNPAWFPNDPDREFTFGDFMDKISEGFPEAGIEGDDTLKGFMRGGSGFDTFKYPLGYSDRKQFNQWLGTIALGPGSGIAAAGLAGTRALVGAGRMNRLTAAFLGQSRSTIALRDSAALIRTPIGKMASGASRVMTSTPAVVGYEGFLGYGLYRSGMDWANPEATQGAQAAAIEAFQGALTAGDYEEAEVIYAAAEANELDMGAVAVAEDGTAFTYETHTGETVAVLDPATGERAVGPDGEVLEFGEHVPEPTAEGTIVTVPARFAATFGAEGILAETPLTFIEGRTDPEELLGVEYKAFSDLYLATRWFPVSQVADRLEEQSKMVAGAPSLLADRQGAPRSNIRIDAGEAFRTEQIRPIFRGDDYTEYLNSLGPTMLVATQALMVQAGYLDPDTSASGTRFQPGLIDANTRAGMLSVMIDADANGFRDIQQFLHKASRTGKGFGDDGGGGGGFRRAPFERHAYLAPDYDTLTQYIKGVVNQRIGRKFNDSEMVLAADQMKDDHRANFEITEKARRATYDAAGRGGDPGFVGEMVDMEASFKEFFDTKYAAELERRDTVEDVYNSTQNFFGSLDNAARLIGR